MGAPNGSPLRPDAKHPMEKPVVPCLVCKGGNRTCREGHTGTYCLTCSQGYGQMADGLCEFCTTKTKTELLTSGIVAFVVLLIASVGFWILFRRCAAMVERERDQAERRRSAEFDQAEARRREKATRRCNSSRSTSTPGMSMGKAREVLTPFVHACALCIARASRCCAGGTPACRVTSCTRD